MAILLPPAEGSIAPWRDLRQPCVPGCFSGHCDLGRSCPALRLMFYSSITSTCQRASLPDEVGITSACPLFSENGGPLTVNYEPCTLEAKLSTTLFLG